MWPDDMTNPITITTAPVCRRIDGVDTLHVPHLEKMRDVAASGSVLACRLVDKPFLYD